MKPSQIPLDCTTGWIAAYWRAWRELFFDDREMVRPSVNIQRAGR